MRCANRVHLAAAGVCDFHFFRAGRISLMLHPHRRAVQANADRRAFIVQLGVVCPGQDHIAHRVAGNRLRNEFAHQQACDGRVAVRKVKEIFVRFLVGDGITIHALSRPRLEIHSGKPGRPQSPRVLRGNRVESHTKQRLGHRLKKFHHFGADFDHVSEKAVVAHAGKAGFLFV